MGRPKSLKHNGPEGQSGRRPEGLPKRTSARSSTSSAHLSDRSIRFWHQPPPCGVFDRKGLAQNIASYSDPASPTGDPVGSLLTTLLRLARPGPTGAIQPGTPARKGPGSEQRRQGTSQTMILGTIPCTPARTVLHDHPNTNSIVGADICVYSIVGAVGLPYDNKPPTCL